MKEVWKFIQGFDKRYSISNYGRVMSHARHIGNGKGYYKPQKILKLSHDQDGYLIVSITVKNRINKVLHIHKEVAKHFISANFNSNNHICHKDGNKLNNCVTNLYIGNHETNTMDNYRLNKYKLSIDDIIKIREIGNSIKQKDIGLMFNIKQGYVSRILSNIRCKIEEQTQINYEESH